MFDFAVNSDAFQPCAPSDETDAAIARVVGATASSGATDASDMALTRLFDILIATIILIVALPPLVLVAIALQIDSPGPLFFRQKRIGKNGKLFDCLKFRTMCVDADKVLKTHLAECRSCSAEWQRDFKLRRDPRVTRLGKFVRKFSLDEFPQLINVLRNEMSIVGPRPIVPAEAERYGRHFDFYCSVKPGLTGLWQVSGRNEVTYRRRVAIDRYYVTHRSLWMDTMIVVRTVPAVVLPQGY